MRLSRVPSPPRRALRGSSTSRATARSAACARASTTPCRPREWTPSSPSCRTSSAVRADLQRAMSFRILTLNDISPRGLARLPRERYAVGPEVADPDAILLRSAALEAAAIPASVRAVGRAGAGVNNIPVEALSRRGIPVFNAPGANANAVKELVLSALFLAARNICQAWAYTRGLSGDDRTLDTTVEANKKNYLGYELPGRTLGVIGLGAVGVLVANSAEGLGMKVLGYDPQITVHRAWQLSASVEQALSLDDLFARSDAISVHVPLNNDTRGLVSAARLNLMRPGGVILNFARAAIVDDAAIVAALDAGRLHSYVC